MKKRWILLILVLPTVACVGFVAFAFFLTTPEGLMLRVSLGELHEYRQPPADSIEAKARWSAQGISHYRLVLQRDWNGPVPPGTRNALSCQQDVEILNEQIVSWFQDTCSSSQYKNYWGNPFIATVPALFQQLERDSMELKWLPNEGCKISVVNATYDASLGYPQQITYTTESPSPANMGVKPYLSAQPSGGIRFTTCLAIGFVGIPSIKIRSFTALP
jgi:hypothetical protein